MVVVVVVACHKLLDLFAHPASAAGSVGFEGPSASTQVTCVRSIICLKPHLDMLRLICPVSAIRCTSSVVGIFVFSGNIAWRPIRCPWTPPADPAGSGADRVGGCIA
eukprot:GHVS01059087.1.p1 GENE.GHVS01059087.1~~GHVS01059087.1.p1  ORF type:complete len:107 (+),score=13.11 GHVS01059087.1:57-377(+)